MIAPIMAVQPHDRRDLCRRRRPLRVDGRPAVAEAAQARKWDCRSSVDDLPWVRDLVGLAAWGEPGRL